MINVGVDYSKDRKNDYTAEIEDGYVASILLYVHAHALLEIF